MLSNFGRQYITHFYKQSFISGACHADELLYLFPIGKELFISAAPTKEDTQIRKAITELWVNFAKTG